MQTKKFSPRPLIIPLLFLVFSLSPVLAGSGSSSYAHTLEHRMMVLALQIGIILFAGHWGSNLARRVGIPAIMGELLAGILIGPYLLGALPLPGYPSGLFPVADTTLAITPELYGFAVVASIVLLFLTGLQTDLRLFLRFAFKGSVVGLGGATLSLLAGITVATIMTGNPPLAPGNIFLGVVATATSVDISARILSSRKKMASPEGVTILSASVIEDVVGITLLAVILSVDAMEGTLGNGGGTWRFMVPIAARALTVWLGCTALGILFSRRIGNLLKGVRNQSQIAVLALGLALILAGLFESAGLAMIIGAYVMGLSLANTDISYVVQEKIEVIHHFFDPIFFTVIGMLVNLFVITSLEVLFFGVFFALLATAAKLIGCGGASLVLGFNRAGAIRIGMGMVPRGEVALIMLAIGLSSGVLEDRLFGVAIVMTLITTLVAPPFFNRLLSRTLQTTRQALTDHETTAADFHFGSEDLTKFLLSDVIQTMRNEGFFVTGSETEHKVFHMRKDSVFIALMATPVSLHFTCRKEDVTLVNNLVYESVLSLQQQVGHIKTVAKPQELRKGLVEKTNRAVVDWPKYLPVECIHLRMEVENKELAIRELVESLTHGGKLKDPEAVLEAILERERTMSTGMEHGIAIPHGRSEGVKELTIAVGIVPKGVDFQSLDGEPTRIIFLVASPRDNPGPHLQILAGIAGIVNSSEAREEMLRISSRSDLIRYMVENSRPKKRTP
ncbi:transporter, CPA2 family [Alkalispirochaeta americana]|uniref:Transporter, CPA2 family n=1 Tax=Alkalispirochaeta americana TaxID=159291 RepID=A0A1N6WY73_9SPIO|nr:cation:proton antiporter [Alkalispirochaeta americana]SIQ95059.1 transporter, CPA2 family [Alkalispirochaeta americana]